MVPRHFVCIGLVGTEEVQDGRGRSDQHQKGIKLQLLLNSFNTRARLLGSGHHIGLGDDLIAHNLSPYFFMQA